MSRDYVVDVLKQVRKALPTCTHIDPVPVFNPLCAKTDRAIEGVEELLVAARQAEQFLEYLLTHAPEEPDKNRTLARLRRALNACGAPHENSKTTVVLGP